MVDSVIYGRGYLSDSCAVMSLCEKCWSDAAMRQFRDTGKAQVEHYLDLLEERKDNPCSEEEQGFGHATEPTEQPAASSSTHQQQIS